MFDAIRDSAEEKTVVPPGTVVAGDGFTVRTPVDGLRAIRDQPRPGFLCLRYTTALMYLGLGSYDVFPFTLDPPAPTLRAAWLANSLSFFTDRGRAGYQILGEHNGSWRGQPAYFQSAYSKQLSNGAGAVMSGCVIRHGSKYYWVVRSLGVNDDKPGTVERSRVQAEKEFMPFLSGLIFSPDTPPKS